MFGDLMDFMTCGIAIASEDGREWFSIKYVKDDLYLAAEFGVDFPCPVHLVKMDKKKTEELQKSIAEEKAKENDKPVEETRDMS